VAPQRPLQIDQVDAEILKQRAGRAITACPAVARYRTFPVIEARLRHGAFDQYVIEILAQQLHIVLTRPTPPLGCRPTVLAQNR
jgi:hypothetical protein